jgi:predicted nucleic acid-binding protein
MHAFDQIGDFPSPPVPAIVLDTNVLLDWLVFGNPAVQPLVDALGAGRLRWVATDAMRDELAHVLARGVGARWPADAARWQAAWANHAQVVPAPVAPLVTPRCTDRDDQKFIDLALHVRARWLLSRDRALLKLARAARRHGVDVLTPDRWAALTAA